MKSYDNNNHSASYEVAIAVRVYLKKDQVTEKDIAKRLADMVHDCNEVYKVETASSKHNPNLCRLTFVFKEPVPVASEEILNNLLECYYNLLKLEWTLVIVADGKEHELTIWDSEDVTVIA